MNSEIKLDQILFTHIEDYELHWQNQYHYLLLVHLLQQVQQFSFLQ
jgi:hypothetical protein